MLCVYRPLLGIRKIEKSLLNGYEILGLYGGFLDTLTGWKRVSSVTDDAYIQCCVKE